MARTRRPGRPTAGEMLLDGLFRRLGLTDEARAWRALAAWHAVTRDSMASRTRAERFRSGILFVRVTSSAWAQELVHLKSDLLDKLHHQPGGDLVTDIRFTVGPLADAPDWEGPEPDAHAPGEAPVGRAGRLGAFAPGAAGDSPGGGVSEAEIEAVLDTVSDPELRASLAALIRRG